MSNIAEKVFETVNMSWLEYYSNHTGFWLDSGIAVRVCSLLERILLKDSTLFASNKPERADVDRLLSAFVGLDLAEGKQLEEILSRSD
ncbi:MAG: hypothetical protein ABSB19_10130 [Methylomonas sp.]|jgi:hypothetical protein